MKYWPTCSLLALLVCGFDARLVSQPNAAAEDPPTLPSVSAEGEERLRPSSEHDTASVEWVFHRTEDGAHPNGDEQQMVWLMNRARSDPMAEGLYLADTGNARVVSSIDFFDVDLGVMKAEFELIAARPPAAFDRRIYEGSRVHSEDLIARDAQDHDNQFQRMSEAGFAANGANASVFSFAEDAVHAHAAFNIDWGNDGGDGSGMQPNRGHRDGIMAESLLTTNVGIAMVAENVEETNVGPLVTSIIYAIAFSQATDHSNRFLVGTVWEDGNQNGLYEPGEGLGGVTVRPDRGEFFAVTADSGGWAIPATIEGEYTIAFSGGELAEPQQRSATVDEFSVLVLWNGSDSHLGTPPNATLARIDTAGKVSWIAESGHEYDVQLSHDLIDWRDDDRPIAVDGELRFLSFSLEEVDPTLFVRIVSRRTE